MTFDLEKTIRYWHEGAKYDLGVSDAMFKTKKYPYALFMGHLALEKLLKAFVCQEYKSSRSIQPLPPLLGRKIKS
jgi:HEPN domain-containing protein